MHPLFKKYKLKHLSASQVKTFKRSPFTWICEKVLGMRSPGSEATTFGSFIHHNFERGLAGKDIQDIDIPEDCLEFYHDEWKEKLVKFWTDYQVLKPKGEETLEIEGKFDLQVHKDLPPFIGFVDVLTKTSDGILIEDHKTIGNKAYAPKTAKDLLTEDQLMIYAEVMYRRFGDDTFIQVRHNQLFKKIKRKPVNLLITFVPREEAASRIESIGKDALGMIKALEIYEEGGIEAVAKAYAKEYEASKFDFGGCKLISFFEECMKNVNKGAIESSPQTEDNDVHDLHKTIGEAREHCAPSCKTKFDLADKVTDLVVGHIKEEGIKDVFVRQGGSNGDLIMNQTLNQLAEMGVRIYERIF